MSEPKPIQLGLCCINTILRAQKPPVFCSRKMIIRTVEEKGIDSRRIQPIGKGEAEPASWTDENGKAIVLTERYINKFRSSDKAKFERLHQINRRTTARITSQDFDPNTATPANPEWMEFKPLK